MHGAHHLHAIVGNLPRDHQTRIMRIGGSRKTIRRFGQFQRDHGAALRHTQNMAEIGARCVFRQNTHAHVYACFAQNLMAAARDARIRIFDRGDNTRETCIHNGIGARARNTVMAARLQSHIECRDTCGCACIGDGNRFCMRATALLCGTTPDNDAIFDNKTADCRIGRSFAQSTSRKGDGSCHIIFVRKKRRAHFSSCAGPLDLLGVTGSASSSMMVEKSLASRKFL